MRARFGGGVEAEAISPSLKHFLMAGPWKPGHLAPARLPDWLGTLHSIASDDGLEQAWRQHRDELTAEARAAGFAPAAAQWFDVGPEPDYSNCIDVYAVLPADPARAAWSRIFCERWRY